MNDALQPPAAGSIEPGEPVTAPDDTPPALEGETAIPSVARPRRHRWSSKALLAIGLPALLAVVTLTVAVDRYLGHRPAGPDTTGVGERPAAAGAEPRRLDLDLPLAARSTLPVTAATAGSTPPLIPAIVPTADDRPVDPIGVRRTGTGGAGGSPRTSPEDAPVLLVTSRPGAISNRSTASTDPTERNEELDPADPLDGTRRNLEAYQHQLQTLMQSISTGVKGAEAAPTVPSLPPTNSALAGLSSAIGSPGVAGMANTPNANAAAPASLFGGQLQGSATPRVAAAMLAPPPMTRSLTLPKGTAFTCALKTKVISAASGFVGCQVQRNVYGDDGRVLLIERGSHLDGEYRIGTVRPGMVRIPVLWARLRTPLGVTVDLDSPATGALGESGIDGYVDNRWPERIGAAMLLSLIDDSVQLIIQDRSSASDGDHTVVMPSTAGSTSKLAEKVLESTIDIPPLIYRNQGGVVGIYVARDVDFSSVYRLQAADR